MTSKRRQPTQVGPAPLQLPKQRRLEGDDLFIYAKLSSTVEHAMQQLEAFGSQMKDKYRFSDAEILDPQGFIRPRPTGNQSQPAPTEPPDNESPTPGRRRGAKAGTSGLQPEAEQ